MAQAMVNFRMDEDLKRGMEKTCKEMGMSMTTAFTIFAAKVNSEKRIPFDISANPSFTGERLRETMKSMQKEAAINGTADMTMDEIDEIIAEVRREKREQK